METELLQNMLDQLHREFSKLKSIDEDLRERLEQIMVDMEVLLDEYQNNETFLGDGLIKKIKNLVDDFEKSHPRMTKSLSEIADSLSRMGI